MEEFYRIIDEYNQGLAQREKQLTGEFRNISERFGLKLSEVCWNEIKDCPDPEYEKARKECLLRHVEIGIQLSQDCNQRLLECLADTPDDISDIFLPKGGNFFVKNPEEEKRLIKYLASQDYQIREAASFGMTWEPSEPKSARFMCLPPEKEIKPKVYEISAGEMHYVVESWHWTPLVADESQYGRSLYGKIKDLIRHSPKYVSGRVMESPAETFERVKDDWLKAIKAFTEIDPEDASRLLERRDFNGFLKLLGERYTLVHNQRTPVDGLNISEWESLMTR